MCGPPSPPPLRILSRAHLLPEPVPQHALVQLAVVLARQGVGELDGSGAFETGQALSTPRHQLRLKIGRALRTGLELDDRLHLLAPLGAGNADDGDVADEWVADEHRLGLGRIDVDTP